MLKTIIKLSIILLLISFFVCNKKSTNSEEFKIIDIVKGTGASPVTGNRITVHYKGTLTDGSVFDSSYRRGTPFTFRIGQGRVIQGWEKGFMGMKVGGKRKLIIPANMAYGSRARPGIPANSTLIFEVELLDVQP